METQGVGCPRSEYSNWRSGHLPHVSLITSAKPLDAIRWRQASAWVRKGLLFHSLMDANESAVVAAARVQDRDGGIL